jgi:hypothetical protein
VGTDIAEWCSPHENSRLDDMVEHCAIRPLAAVATKDRSPPISAVRHRRREGQLRVTSSGLIMSRLGQVSLTKPTYRRIVLRCCSVPQRSPRQITSIGSHCGRTLWAIPLRAHGILQAGRSRPRYESGATGIGKLENGSRPEAISEIARLRRSLPEPDPENRAAISIRSARPPIITVIGGWTIVGQTTTCLA